MTVRNVLESPKHRPDIATPTRPHISTGFLPILSDSCPYLTTKNASLKKKSDSYFGGLRQNQLKVRMCMRVTPMAVIPTFYEINIEDRMKIYHEADIVSYALSGSDMQFVDKLRANKQLLDMDSRRTRGINGKIIVAEIGSASRTPR